MPKSVEVAIPGSELIIERLRINIKRPIIAVIIVEDIAITKAKEM